jgi:hypothetical protein
MRGSGLRCGRVFDAGRARLPDRDKALRLLPGRVHDRPSTRLVPAQDADRGGVPERDEFRREARDGRGKRQRQAGRRDERDRQGDGECRQCA